MLGRGDMIAGYRIDDMIGVGGMAVVYRAEQVSLGRRVALKVLSEQLNRDEAFRERFRREGRHAAALHHPNVVTIFDSGDADGRLFIAMLLVEGSTLAARMALGNLRADETISLLTPIGGALDAAHALGLVHRDVKPQNVLLDTTGHPYLADFGIAKASAGTVGLTGTGDFVGTINYSAPEQIRGEGSTSAVDIYALTAMLYQCLTGAVPFPRDTDASVMYAHLTDPPPALEEASPAAVTLNRIVARGMAKDPTARYPLASEVMTEAAELVSCLDSGARALRPIFPTTVGTRSGDARPSHGPEAANDDHDNPRHLRQSKARPTTLPTVRTAPAADSAPASTADPTTGDRRRGPAGGRP